MSQYIPFTEAQLEAALAIVELCNAVREGRPIDRGMVNAIRIVLNWRSLIDEDGRPHEDLFSAPMDDVLTVFHQVDVPKGGHCHNSQRSNFEEF